MKNNKIIVTVIILIFLIISSFADLYYYNKMKMPPKDGAWQIAYSDFRVFWTTAKEFSLRYLNDPGYGPIDKRYGPIYDFKEEFYHFRYSPFVAFVFTALTQLPIGMALILWTFLLNIFFLLSLIILNHIFSDGVKFSINKKLACSFVICLLALRFYLNNIALGQSDVFVAFLWCVFLFFYMRKAYFLSAAAFAIILQFKPFFFPIFLYFIFSGKWRLSMYAVLTFFAFLTVPMVKIGYRYECITLVSDWVRMVFYSSESQLGNFKNQSFVYMLSKIFGSEGRVYLIYLSAAAYSLFIAALLFFRYLKSVKPDHNFAKFEVSYLVLATLLSSPLIWKASLVYTIVPSAFILYAYAGGMKDRVSYIFIGIFFVLTSVLSPDITKYIPLGCISSIQLVPLGTFFLFLSLIYSYNKQVGCSEHPRR